MNGKSYTLKNIKNISSCVDKWSDTFNIQIVNSKGNIQLLSFVYIPVKDIRCIEIKHPEGEMIILFHSRYVDICDGKLTFTQDINSINFSRGFK